MSKKKGLSKIELQKYLKEPLKESKTCGGVKSFYRPPLTVNGVEEKENTGEVMFEVLTSCHCMEKDIYLTSDVLVKILSLLKQNPNREWGAFLKLEEKEEKTFVVDILVPPQEVTAATWELSDPKFDRTGFYGVIHSHCNMSVFHSGTDVDHLVSQYKVSIVVNNSLEFSGTMDIKLDCGKDGQAKIKVHLPLFDTGDKIKTRVFKETLYHTYPGLKDSYKDSVWCKEYIIQSQFCKRLNSKVYLCGGDYSRCCIKDSQNSAQKVCTFYRQPSYCKDLRTVVTCLGNMEDCIAYDTWGSDSKDTPLAFTADIDPSKYKDFTESEKEAICASQNECYKCPYYDVCDEDIVIPNSGEKGLAPTLPIK